MPTKTTERSLKTVPAYVLKADAALGQVEAIVSVFGIVDMGADVILPGAYAKTITERAGKIRVLDNHNTFSTLNIIARPLLLKEIGRPELPAELLALYPEATGGLFTVSQFFMQTPEGKGVFDRISEGVVEYSIGYDVIQEEYGQITTADGKKITVRYLKEIRLWEYSPVIWGMNQATWTVGAKGNLPMGENVPTPPNQPTPPDKKEMTPDGPVKRIGDYLVGQAQSAFTDCINRMVTDGFIDYDEYTALIEKGLACMKDLRANIPEAVALRPYSRSGYSYDDLFLWSADPTLAAKAGRMLSAANARRLQSAWDEISAILEAAGLMDTDESDEADTADSDGKAAPQPDAEPGEDPSLTLQALEQMRAELTDLRAKHK